MVYKDESYVKVDGRYHVHVVARRPGAGPAGGDIVDVTIVGQALAPCTPWPGMANNVSWSAHPAHYAAGIDHSWAGGKHDPIAFELLSGHYWRVDSGGAPHWPTVRPCSAFPAHFPAAHLPPQPPSESALPHGEALLHSYWDCRYQLRL
jgi:hypothetical protein